MTKHARRRIEKLFRLVGTAGYRRGLLQGVAAAIEHRDAMRSLAIGTLIDVGANVGQFSLLVRTLHPSAIIHAFEPLTSMADRYATLFKDDAQTTLHRLAAGEIPGDVMMNVSERPDSSSLLPISERQNEIFPGTAKASLETIRVTRIDDALENIKVHDPILIKLDVQGFELSALKGMPKLLTRAAHVYAEVSFVELYEGQPLASELITWLAHQNFEIAGVHNPTFMASGATVQADVLFARVEDRAFSQ